MGQWSFYLHYTQYFQAVKGFLCIKKYPPLLLVLAVTRVLNKEEEVGLVLRKEQNKYTKNMHIKKPGHNVNKSGTRNRELWPGYE